MPSISEKLLWAERALAAAGVSEARREAASLLAFALRKDRTFLIAHPEYFLTESEESEFGNVVSRRASREPFQYITGVQEFFGLDFEVTPDVLIPRPETEMIVETGIELLSGGEQPRFCEVGIGSGCITVSILCNVKRAVAVGLDISPAALAVSRRNAERHDVADRVDLRESDVFAAIVDERFDLIASNPPYVPRQDIAGLQEEVRDFEPLNALTDGNDGLSIIRRLVFGSPRYLVPGGWLLMEIGFSQAPAVCEMFDPQAWRSVDLLPDLQGIPRMVKARLK